MRTLQARRPCVNAAPPWRASPSASPSTRGAACPRSRPAGEQEVPWGQRVWEGCKIKPLKQRLPPSTLAHSFHASPATLPPPPAPPPKAHLLLRHLDARHGADLEPQRLVVQPGQRLAAPPVRRAARGAGEPRVPHSKPRRVAAHRQSCDRHILVGLMLPAALAPLSASGATPTARGARARLFSMSKSLSALPAPSARRSPLSSAPSDARRLATAPAKRHSPPHWLISSL